MKQQNEAKVLLGTLEATKSKQLRLMVAADLGSFESMPSDKCYRELQRNVQTRLNHRAVTSL